MRCSESESKEMCAGADTSVSSRFSVNSSNHFGRSSKRFPAASWLSFVFEFWFLRDRVGFPTPVRHFVNLLDSKKNLMSLAEMM